MTNLMILFIALTFFHSQEQEMNKSNQPYTHGLWIVKAGNEKAFIEEWSKFAKWTSNNHPGAGNGHLLQDSDNPQLFISFGPWKDAESIKTWREDPEFKKFVAKAKELCDSFQPRSLRIVASSTD